MRRALAAGLLAAIAATTARAAEPRWYLQLDNDLFVDSERWYTSGARLARGSGEAPVETELGILHEIYTPEVRYYELGRVDRAPSARLLLYAARHDRGERRFQTLEAAIGVRGPSALGEQVADFVHAVVGAREVFWNRQEGDQLDVQLAAVRSDTHGPWRLHYGLVLGSEVAYAHGALEWRFGDGAGPGAHAPALRYAATPPPDARNGHGWDGFLGVGGRLVARNELLDRGYDVLAPPPTKERWIGRIALGAAARRSWGSIVFAVVQDTAEFREQRRPQRFGSLTLQLAF